MKIQKFDKTNLRPLREAIEAALAAPAAEFGIALELKKISYNDTTFRVAIEAALTDANGEAVKPEVIDYSESISFLKLPKLGTKFVSNGRDFEVTRHEPSRPKYNVIAKDVRTGKMFKFIGSEITDRLNRLNGNGHGGTQ